MHVHHIKPFKAFNYLPGVNNNYLKANNLNNLICFCDSCHMTEEQKRQKNKRE
jgi:predicted HNH restriction endonuclease